MAIHFSSQKNRLARKSIITIMLLFNFIFLAPQAHAQVWGVVNIFSNLMLNLIENIEVQIKAAILGTLKVAAIAMVNSKIGQMVGGKSAGSAMVVSDWEQFLYQEPKEKVDLHMKDFFSKITAGKYASNTFVGIGDVSKNVEGNYVNTLVENAKASIDPEASNPEYDLDQYTDNPEELFQNGDFQALDAMIKNPANNPFGVELMAQDEYAKKNLQEQEIAKIKATASGFKAPTDKDGKPIAPVATVQNMVNDAQNIGNNLMAVAKDPGEFLAGVVGAVVNKAITNMIQKGVGKMQANIKREVGNFDKKVTKAIDKADKQLGPAARYLKGVSQRTDTTVRPYTKPPPNPYNVADCGAAC